ncbi:MAG: hypothetical protein HY275_02865 [Gemmatimonadetes bacterium]|nr:hypothetical protein [Gemmatimonadota bacterium]
MRRAPLALLLLAVVSACTDDGLKVRPQLVRVAAGAPGASLVVAGGAPRAIAGPGGAWSSAVTIESFEVPLRGVTIAASMNSGGARLYACSADTNDGCLVDVAGTAFADLLRAHDVSVPAGTFNVVQVETCHAEGQYTAYLKGSVVLAGKTWYTRSSGVLDTVGPSQRTALLYQGCARTYPLAQPLDLRAAAASAGSATGSSTAGGVVTFRMYIDLRDIAWGALGLPTDGAAWLPGGCSTTVRPGTPGTAQVPFVCTGYPDIIATVGEQLPVVERYRIDGASTIGLLFTADTDHPLGGYTRRFYVENTAYAPDFSADIPVRDLRKNADGTLYLSTYGGSDGLPTTPGRFQASAFQRTTHVGSYSTDGSPAGSYSAVRLP